jgi:hypothetical protein
MSDGSPPPPEAGQEPPDRRAAEIKRLTDELRRDRDYLAETERLKARLSTAEKDRFEQRQEIERLTKSLDVAEMDHFEQRQEIERLKQGWRSESDKFIAELRDAYAKVERLQGLYNDLLYQVEQKHPDETRHETARRLIREAQRQPAKAALVKEDV